jgi:oxygen-dependent protoporphyrinogen oxidase
VAATAVERGGAGYRVSLEDGGTIAADQVILSTPAFATAGLVERLDPELARELREIPFVSTATVSLAFAAPAVTRPLEGYGYVSPRAEGGPVVACTVTSNKFPDRVPPGGVLIRFFIGRAGHENLVEQSESVLVDIARTELAQVLGLSVAPEFTRVFRWRNSMPQYVVGHPARLVRLERLRSAHPGLQLAGASYRGVGIPDCISSGWAAASAVLIAAKVAA